jgi:hypothetical protein
MSNIEQAILQLQDNMLVIAEMERRQTEPLREHADMLHQHNLVLAETIQFPQRTEQKLAEITDKLNGLIGYVHGLHRPPTQPN